MIRRFILLTVIEVHVAFLSFSQYSATTSDLNMNWVVSKLFSYDGSVQSIGKKYYDNTGAATQAQVRNMSAGQVVATQVLKDALGRPVITTMAAPVNNSDFGYKSNFALNGSGTAYNYQNFDDAKVNNPDPIGGQNTAGTLGWYYSDNNTMETRVATSSYPYIRSDFYRDGTGAIKRSAEMGDAYRMGQGREMSNYVIPVINELSQYLQVRNKYFTVSEIGEEPSALTGLSIQAVTKDVTGKEFVNIVDREGKVLVTAMPGNDLSVSNTVTLKVTNNYPFSVSGTSTYGTVTFQSIIAAADINVYSVSYSGTYTSIYNGPSSGWVLPQGGSGNVVVESSSPFTATYQVNDGFGNITTYTNVASTITATPSVFYFKILQDNTSVTISGNYTLYDMSTEQTTTLLTGNKLNKGYYKIAAGTGSNFTTLTYSNSYSDISYNYYNQLGELVASITPEGVKKLIQNINAYPTKASVPFLTTLEYDAKGRLIASTNQDNGRSEFIFRKDGKLRFSQNAKQRVNGWFSYVNYDVAGRIVEGGEYRPTGDITFTALKTNNAILEDISSTGGLTISSNKYDWVKTKYDVEDNSHGQSGYLQGFVRGAVSMSESPESKTWYSYNEENKIIWVIKWINGLGYKTTDYYYDNNGRVIKIVYQKNTSAETFVHYFEYDADGRLEKSYTNTTDNPLNKLLQARYIYFVHGPLKRVELGGNLQGLDYTYTLDGKLKAINHSDVTKDPGSDGTNGFLQDAFGEVMEYYNTDYTRTGTNIGSMSINTSDAAEQFGGLVRGFSWFSKKPTASGASNSPTMYVFKYDSKNQFSEATWGSTSGSSFVPQPGINKETISGYDMHGNILNLSRTNGAGSTTDNFLYNYIQTPLVTNQLGSITQQTPSVQNYATYQYDNLGELTAELPGPAYGSSVNKYLQYDVTGKVGGVYSSFDFSTPLVKFVYDEMGKRIKKLSYNTSGVLLNTTYYVYAAGGVLMSIYEQPSGGGIAQKEIYVYGNGDRVASYFKSSGIYRYELNDHLGNVRAVFYKTVSNNIDMVVYRDYYPFGMVIPTREYFDGDGYRYSYQGKFNQKDPETAWNAFELRMYDSKIGRWLSIDPEAQHLSPYVGMGNNPVSSVDPDGGCENPPCDPSFWAQPAKTNSLRYDGEGNAFVASFMDGHNVWAQLLSGVRVQEDPRDRWFPKFWDRYVHHQPIIQKGEEYTNYASYAEQWKKEEDSYKEFDRLTLWFVGGLVLFPVAVEAGFTTVAANYGRKVVVEFVKETIVNGGDPRKNDYFDIFVGAAGPDNFTAKMIKNAVTASVDFEDGEFRVVGANKSVKGALVDFTFSSLSTGVNQVMGGGDLNQNALDVAYGLQKKMILYIAK